MGGRRATPAVRWWVGGGGHEKTQGCAARSKGWLRGLRQGYGELEEGAAAPTSSTPPPSVPRSETEDAAYVRVAAASARRLARGGGGDTGADVLWAALVGETEDEF